MCDICKGVRKMRRGNSIVRKVRKRVGNVLVCLLGIAVVLIIFTCGFPEYNELPADVVRESALYHLGYTGDEMKVMYIDNSLEDIEGYPEDVADALFVLTPEHLNDEIIPVIDLSVSV